MSRLTVRAEAFVIEREERTGYPIRIKVQPRDDSDVIILYQGTGFVTAWYDKAETIFKHFPHLAKILKEQDSAVFDFFGYNLDIAIVSRKDVLWLN